MTVYPLLMEPKTVSIRGKDQLLSIRAADVQFWQLQTTNVSCSSTSFFTHPQSPFLHTCEWQNHADLLPNSCCRRWLRPSGSLVPLQGRSRPSSSLEPRIHAWSKFRGQTPREAGKKFPAGMRSLGARELLLFFYPFSVISFIPRASQV